MEASEQRANTFITITTNGTRRRLARTPPDTPRTRPDTDDTTRGRESNDQDDPVRGKKRPAWHGRPQRELDWHNAERGAEWGWVRKAKCDEDVCN